MKVDAARSLVDDLKHAIKLGKDPKTVIEERRKAKTLTVAIKLWKEKDTYIKLPDISNLPLRILKIVSRIGSILIQYIQGPIELS